MPKHCPSCGAALTPSARFCHRCGTAVGAGASASDAAVGGAPSTRPTAPSLGGQALPWAVAGIALLCLLAFIVGQNWQRLRAPASPARVAGDAPATGARAVDISQMSPDERADRLFNRVMTYVTQGKSDSVTFFAPMAIQSFEALAPLDAHRRYDLGLLGVVSGDAAMARAQADSILAGQPSHLLGLILGMRAAGVQLDTLARRRFAERFDAALATERARRLPEYLDHEPDIDAAVRDAASRR
jgi:hypothetical protein